MAIKSVPSHWLKLPNFVFNKGDQEAGCAVFEHRLVQMRVLRSLSTVKDGSKWIHISVSRPDGLPSWADMTKVKNDFIGEDREAYQVIPKTSDRVNVAECLHLWSPLDEVRRVANLYDLVKEVPV